MKGFSFSSSFIRTLYFKAILKNFTGGDLIADMFSDRDLLSA